MTKIKDIDDTKNNHSESQDENPGNNDDGKTLVDSLNVPKNLTYVANANHLEEDQTFVNGYTGSSSDQGVSFRGASPQMNAELLKIKYNENRVSLDRAINQTINILRELSQENKERPVFYPTKTNDDSQAILNSAKAHLAFVRNSELSEKALQKSKIHDEYPIPEFKLIRIDFKMGHSGQNAAASLDKQAIATLLEHSLSHQVRYLMNLKDRIDDTSSKVFVTGDLNAGKSSFCNKLMRRKVLPEDQQPCTQVFCEVIDAKRENRGVEEVHAVPHGAEYNIKDELSYKVFPLKALKTLVNECDNYAILKVYLIDNRDAQESLLSNGVVDVKLIDAPGLNMDSYQTTQVFSRQEEIDLVVFVVNAENHFTLSAKEFISAAAAEKRYVFIVVNKFDNIKKKDKCKTKILDQVKSLSPDTHKSSDEFVHFVTSEDPNGDSDDSDGENNNDDDNDDDNEINYDDPDFHNLEASLRKFLLDKRSISKLLPAKSYLSSLLGDLKSLADINEKIYEIEKQENLLALEKNIVPQFEDAIRKSSKVNDVVATKIENICTEIYDESRKEISTTINEFGDEQVVPFLGLQYLFEYARDTQKAMIDTISSSVSFAEGNAKEKTANLVKEVIELGKESLGDEFLQDKVFNSDLMFTRRKDNVVRNLDISVELSDFFDPSLESFIGWIGIPTDIQKLVGSHVDPTHLISSIPSSTEELKNQIPTSLTLHTLYSTTKVLSVGAAVRKAYNLIQYVDGETVRRVITPVLVGLTGLTISYLIYDIPNAFPRKRARKIRKQLLEFDYPHKNAYRISQECRQVLSYPARQVMTNFQTSIDKRSVEKQQLEKKIADADLSYKYFHDLLTKIQHQKKYVQEIDLESVNLVD